MTSPTSTKLLVIIDGPTASGKTNVGVELAREFKSEVISADSRQFYKELKIGTARPSIEELQGIKHHFLGHASIFDEINAGHYEKEATKCIDQLFKSYDILFVVGGSGFYIDALLFGIDDIPSISPEVRMKIVHEYEKRGLAHIQGLLKALDPALYSTIDIQNPKRIIRGLEVSYQTGKRLSDYQLKNKKAKWSYLRIGLDWDREKLYERINKRVDLMMEAGLKDEALKLINHRELNALKTVGYSELFTFADGDFTLEKTVELIKQNTRRYAKRQLTWLRNQSDTHWIDPSSLQEMKLLISNKITSM